MLPFTIINVSSFFFFYYYFQSLKASNTLLTSVRHASYDTSPLVDKINLSEQPNIEIIKNPLEWKYVEQILAPNIIRKPTPKAEYTSGWKPQTIDPTKTSYMIHRTKNQMLPVYLEILFRGTKRTTNIRRIEGDIFAFEEELTNFLEDYLKRKFVIRVNEYSGEIKIRGDYVNLVKHFLMEKGF